jgi:uncharacterized RDD family membrane protein YckC
VYVNWPRLRIRSHFAPQERRFLVYDGPMMEEHVRVQGATGVDLTLRIAGPGNRSYAFIIDWHLRLLLAVAWLMLATLVFKLGMQFKSYDWLLSVLPALAIYFLYHPVIEVALRGRTPGLRIAGLRIVTRQGGTASAGALLIRNLFRIVDSMPAFYLVGLICCFVTANRVRIGDMAAGTLLVLEDGDAAKSLERVGAFAGHSPLSLDALELVDQLLERWDSLESPNRRAIAASLLERLEPAGTGSERAASSAAPGDAELRSRLSRLLRPGEAASR